VFSEIAEFSARSPRRCIRSCSAQAPCAGDFRSWQPAQEIVLVKVRANEPIEENCLRVPCFVAGEIVEAGPDATGRHISENSISRAVTKLEAEGMLRRKPDQRDGRASTLSLTTKGKRLFDQIKNYFAERDDRLVKVLSDKENREFNRLLNRISEASVDRT